MKNTTADQLRDKLARLTSARSLTAQALELQAAAIRTTAGARYAHTAGDYAKSADLYDRAAEELQAAADKYAAAAEYAHTAGEAGNAGELDKLKDITTRSADHCNAIAATLRDSLEARDQ